METSSFATNAFSSTTDDINANDVALGSKVIHYAIKAVGWGVVVASTWGCATLMGGIAMFVGIAILMSLVGALLEITLALTLPVGTVAGVGRTAGRIAGFFTRKTASA